MLQHGSPGLIVFSAHLPVKLDGTRPDVRLVILGGGGMFGALDAIALELGVRIQPHFVVLYGR